jgi:hypothetical protein
LSVKEIDEYVTNGLARPAAHVAPASSPHSIVKPVANTDDDKDSNVEMLDNDGVKDNKATENGAKTATIDQVKATPSRPSSAIRIIMWWSPTDFDTLNKSRDEFNRRIATILSAIHTPDHPLVEWQTSQLFTANDILPADVSRILSIKIASSYKTKTFTFGFRIRTTGTKLKTILQLKALASVKKGEALHFEPSTVPVTQGDIVHVGDILLKDATVTHRAHYKSFLDKFKLPADMPEFDINFGTKTRFESRLRFLLFDVEHGSNQSCREFLSIPERSRWLQENIHFQTWTRRIENFARNSHQFVWETSLICAWLCSLTI